MESQRKNFTMYWAPTRRGEEEDSLNGKRSQPDVAKKGVHGKGTGAEGKGRWGQRGTWNSENKKGEHSTVQDSHKSEKQKKKRGGGKGERGRRE